ncbi:hypothetical protein RB195_014270 [Necator americanus]|uniref:Helitron helicase-like domain-containing protein n=1 Tax=Necator americanus TaxID=51031 RepID=A0ABR1E0J6_NECAM
MQAFADPPARSRGRGRPRIHANDAERQRSHRTAETRNMREARLIANTQRQRSRRQNEDSAERLLRQLEDSHRHQLLKELCDDLFKKHVLGEVEAYVYVIEFQKRGLPHCHMLSIMKHDWKAQTVADVDNAVCAEIPDREEEPEAYEAVTTYMIHRKCGADDPHSPCM